MAWWAVVMRRHRDLYPFLRLRRAAAVSHRVTLTDYHCTDAVGVHCIGIVLLLSTARSRRPHPVDVGGIQSGFEDLRTFCA